MPLQLFLITYEEIIIDFLDFLINGLEVALVFHGWFRFRGEQIVVDAI